MLLKICISFISIVIFEISRKLSLDLNLMPLFSNELKFSFYFLAAVLRKTKWKSVDHDSPGVSSEECSSIGSVDSNYSLDSLPPRGKKSLTF